MCLLLSFHGLVFQTKFVFSAYLQFLFKHSILLMLKKVKEDTQMKIIIFGAGGGIGKHAVTHALNKGYEVTA